MISLVDHLDLQRHLLRENRQPRDEERDWVKGVILGVHPLMRTGPRRNPTRKVQYYFLLLFLIFKMNGLKANLWGTTFAFNCIMQFANATHITWIAVFSEATGGSDWLGLGGEDPGLELELPSYKPSTASKTVTKKPETEDTGEGIYRQPQILIFTVFIEEGWTEHFRGLRGLPK